MGDPLSTIRSLAADQAAHEAQLRSSLSQLADHIVEALSGAQVDVSSKQTVLEHYGDDESMYGFLSYDKGQLSVAYRSTEEDVTDYLHQDAIEPTYSVKRLQDCPFKWLRAISQQTIIDSFFEHMIAALNREQTEAAEGIGTIGRALNAPIRDAEAALEAAARQLGYEDVLTEWRGAQTSMYTDPREAITRSSSLIETVCKHVLTAKSLPLPANQSIQSSLKATLRALGLAPEEQPNGDLRQIVGGIMSVVHGLGALRTHVGTAHGRAPGGRVPTHIEARLAVNLAGVASTFLMEAASSGQREVR